MLIGIILTPYAIPRIRSSFPTQAKVWYPPTQIPNRKSRNIFLGGLGAFGVPYWTKGLLGLLTKNEE